MDALKKEFEQKAFHLIPNTNIISIKWIESPSMPQVKKTCESLFSVIEKHKINTLLSDLSNCKGFNNEAYGYINLVFYPNLSKSGIIKHAIVFSEEIFKRLMKGTFRRFYASHFEVETFCQQEDAINWLRNNHAKSAS
ncbi:MAG: hypothetical protein AAGI07_17270 [Bacteroidota bacterium]